LSLDAAQHKKSSGASPASFIYCLEGAISYDILKTCVLCLLEEGLRRLLSKLGGLSTITNTSQCRLRNMFGILFVLKGAVRMKRGFYSSQKSIAESFFSSREGTKD